MLVALKDIAANPFRHIERYPIQRKKIEALRESLRKTGYWANVVARETKNGKVEIAYGHHRLQALREEYSASHKVDLIIRDLDDETMIQIMARENMEEWGSNAVVEQETIRAIVEAYAEEKIELPLVPKDAHRDSIRYAPSFLTGERLDRPVDLKRAYTLQTLAQFIGWLEPGGKPRDKLQNAMTALSFIEEGILKEADFDGLSTLQAQSLIEETRRAQERRNLEAKVYQRQAEEAAKEAKKAERRREEAKREQERLEREAAKARDEKARERALQAAAAKVAEQLEAQKAVKLATKREDHEKKKAEAKRIEGREKAGQIGRAVSGSFKRGEIGYRQAREVASKFEAKRDQPRPDIEDFTRKLSTELSTILDPNRDPRAIKLAEIIRFQEHLSELSRADLGRTLEGVSRRALALKDQLSTRTALPAKRG